MISANTPAAVTLAPAPYPLYHHWIFFIPFGSKQNNIITALQSIERMFAVYFLQRHTTFTVFQFRNEAPTFVLALQFPATCLKIGIQRRDFLPELFQRSFEEVTRHEKMFFHICLFQLVSGLARQDNQLADYVFSTQVDTRVGPE